MSKVPKNYPDFVFFENVDKYVEGLDILFDRNNGYYFQMEEEYDIYITHINSCDKTTLEVKTFGADFKDYFTKEKNPLIQQFIIDNHITEFKNKLYLDEAVNFFKTFDKYKNIRIKTVGIMGSIDEPVDIDTINMEIKNLDIFPGTKITSFNKKIKNINLDFDRDTTLYNLNNLKKHNFEEINIKIPECKISLDFLISILIKYGILREFNIKVGEKYNPRIIYNSDNFNNHKYRYGYRVDDQVVEQFQEYFENIDF